MSGRSHELPLQAIAPLLLILTPSFLFLCAQIFRVAIPNGSISLLMSLAAVPVLNPLINLLIIGPYRRAVFSRCR